MKKNRSTLKDYFKKGAIPTDSNFADLIDSMLNQDEDNISKLPNDPLRVTATGADEALLNFYRVEQNEEKLSWQVKQKPGGKPGLSLGDETGSRLFIENTTGKVGIGTTTPAAKLEVIGAATINDGGGYAVKNNFMSSGSLTIGSINTNYGGGSGWNANTAGLLLEAKDNTEIAVHDSGTRLTSLMFYEGGGANRITIGRNMGWGAVGSVVINGNASIGGELSVGGDVTTKKALLMMGTTDGSNASQNEVVGGIGFLGSGVQHGMLAFRAGKGFELVDRSGNRPSLNYSYDAYGYADLKVKTLFTTGNVRLGNSDIYFTKTDHDHSGFGNTDGYAAIENAKNYDALMILGRAHTGGIRTVRLWDYLEVNGNLRVTGYVQGNQVYFSAYLDSNDRSGNLNPVPMQVASQNIGNCYDTKTSKFTAPVKGVYLFTLGGLRSEGSDPLHWFLMVNGKYANSGGTNSTESKERCLVSWGALSVHSSRTIILSLNKDDAVWVQQSGSGRCDNFRSGFEGVLLSANLG